MLIFTPQGAADDFWRRRWPEYSPEAQLKQIADEVYMEVVRPKLFPEMVLARRDISNKRISLKQRRESFRKLQDWASQFKHGRLVKP